MTDQPNPRKIINRDIDFSVKENMVIDALIRLKMARSVTKIAKEAGLARTTTAFILHKLEKRKMAIKIPHPTKVSIRYTWRYKRVPTSTNLL